MKQGSANLLAGLCLETAAKDSNFWATKCMWGSQERSWGLVPSLESFCPSGLPCECQAGQFWPTLHLAPWDSIWGWSKAPSWDPGSHRGWGRAILPWLQQRNTTKPHCPLRSLCQAAFPEQGWCWLSDMSSSPFRERLSVVTVLRDPSR